MNPCIGDRQIDPPEDGDELLRKCWSCLRKIDAEDVKDCDGHCPKCGVEIDEELEDCMPDMSDPGEPNDYPD